MHRLSGRLGALHGMAGEEGGLVRGRSVRRPRAFAGRVVSRGAAGGGYRDSREAMATRTGDRLHAREDGNGREGSNRGDRALHRESRTSLRLQSGNAEDPGTTDARRNRARTEVRPAAIPRRCAQERRVAARHSRGGSDRLHSAREAVTSQRRSTTAAGTSNFSICSFTSWTKLAAPAPFTTR